MNSVRMELSLFDRRSVTKHQKDPILPSKIQEDLSFPCQRRNQTKSQLQVSSEYSAKHIQTAVVAKAIMPPNQTLVYENEDAELVPSYEKKGKRVNVRNTNVLPCVLVLTLVSCSTTTTGYRTTPLFWINGTRVPAKLASQARPNQTMLSFLRETMGLTGSKLGCAEGGCGACTVMVSKLDKETKKLK